MSVTGIGAKEFVLVEALDDFIDLRLLAQHVGDLLRTSDVKTVRNRTLAVIRELLDEELIVVGTLGVMSGEIEPWTCLAEAATERIAREWESLGRAPSLYEIACFQDTPAGQVIGQDLKDRLGLK